MSEHQIPAASQQRLTVALRAFQELAQVVAEAMGLGNSNVRLELERGVFVDVDISNDQVGLTDHLMEGTLAR